MGENESKAEKSIWANGVKNRTNVSVRGRRIQDNEWIARVNDDDEEEEGTRSEVQKIRQTRKIEEDEIWILGFKKEKDDNRN